jgi:hypothetical protein
VADGTERAVIVLWYSMVPQFLARVVPGDIIAIESYRVNRATNFLRDFANVDMELSLNSRNPEGKLYLISEQQFANSQVGEEGRRIGCR